MAAITVIAIYLQKSYLKKCVKVSEKLHVKMTTKQQLGMVCYWSVLLCEYRPLCKSCTNMYKSSPVQVSISIAKKEAIFLTECRPDALRRQ